METTISLDWLRAWLQKDGYSGLYCDGECGCSIEDLAPCGECQREDGEEYINGCEGGYKHVDPTRPDFWVISSRKTPPTQAQFDEQWNSCN